MLATLFTNSMSLSCWMLLKKAALTSFIIVTSLGNGARLPRNWRREIALVSTPDQGSFAGIRIDEHVDGFLGIPYAQAPVGDLRFAMTRPVQAYRQRHIRDASRVGASCLQPPVQVFNDTSEDCLFLNIYRPHFARIKELLPVMLYIHGGSWALGSGALPFYNGTALIHRSLELEEPIMLVTVNYRLGALGFLGGPAVYEADQKKTAVLNAGLHDIRESLQWLQKNIASFGGDPHKVTIWGESAGGNAVAAQMLANSGRTEGLFARGIMQSGSQAILPRQKASDPKPSEAFDLIAQEAGCKGEYTLDCLRQVDSGRLDEANTLAYNKSILFSPLVDNYFVQEPPSSQLSKGRFNRSVPFIHTVNLDEGTQMAAPYADGLTSDGAFAEAVKSLYGESVKSLLPDILKLYPNIPALGQPHRPYYWGNLPNDTFYPPGKDGFINQYKRLASFLQDVMFEAGRRQHLQAAVRAGTPAWSLRFAQPTPEESPFAKFQDTASLSVQHASDIPYVFGRSPIAVNMSKQPKALRPFIADDILNRTTAAMTAYFITFAARGDPNHPDFPYWPQYNGSGKTNTSPGKELIVQPEGILIQDDDEHLKQVNFILDNAANFGM